MRCVRFLRKNKQKITSVIRYGLSCCCHFIKYYVNFFMRNNQSQCPLRHCGAAMLKEKRCAMSCHVYWLFLKWVSDHTLALKHTNHHFHPHLLHTSSNLIYAHFLLKSWSGVLGFILNLKLASLGEKHFRKYFGY